MSASKIEWTDRSDWNPVRGCSRVSPGCGGPGDHGGCYAEWMAARFSLSAAEVEARWRADPKNKGKATPVFKDQWGHGFAEMQGGKPRWTGKVELQEDRLTIPLAWRKPARVFPNSTSDFFHEALADSDIDKLFAVMALCPHLTFQVLTKRAGRMREYCSDPQTPFRVARAMDALSSSRELGPEEVRPIANYPGYFASSHGFIYSEKRGRRRKMNPDAGDQGHLRVQLHRAGKDNRHGDRLLVHRIILETFVGPAPTADTQARHGDGNPSNNAVTNLCWGDQGQNWSDSRRHGSYRRYSKLTVEQAAQIRQRHGAGESGEALAREYDVSATQIRNIASGKQWAVTAPIAWPLPNVWKGTSCERQQEADERIPLLLQTPAAIRFVSLEPLLGSIRLVFGRDENVPHQLDWVIAGGESGPKARPMNPDWARALRDQCRAAGVAFFFKQWGEYAPREIALQKYGPDYDPDNEVEMARVGKKAAGRLLDGREHNECPVRS